MRRFSLDQVLHFRLGISVGLFLVLFTTLYPFYRYVLDDDGVAYATITRRWASGDYYKAINGLWSPLHCWLAVPFFKMGLELPDAFKWSSGCIAIGVLGMTHAWLRTLRIRKGLQLIALLAVLPFLLYISFFELAADVLFCLLFLVYLWFCFRKDAFASSRIIMATGAIGSFCYLAKAYAFPLFLLHFPLWQYWLYKSSEKPDKKKLWIRNLAIGVLSFLLLCLPWIVALHYKYGIWTISLNVNYGLIPYQPLQQTVFSLPPWPDSPTPWEDPFINNVVEQQQVPFLYFIARYPKELLHNAIQLILSLNRFSFLGVALYLGMVLTALQQKRSWLVLFAWSLAALPAGYLLLHIEDRFLWPLYILLLAGGLQLSDAFLQKAAFHPSLKTLFWIFFFTSFWVMPLDILQNTAGKGRNAYLLGRALQKKGLTGRVASNGDYSLMRQVAFHAQNNYIESNAQNVYSGGLAAQVRSLGIDFYYLFYTNKQELPLLHGTALLQNAAKWWHLEEHKLIVIQLNDEKGPMLHREPGGSR